ncbi:MAG: alpha/beta fold hydrolase [Pseudomonadota bacterium]
MNRREVIAAAGIGAAALAATTAPAKAGSHGTTGFLLVHGSWHGAWCWREVEKALRAAGHPTLAIDLPGCGLNAVSPPSYYKRPLDPAAFGSEPSQFATIPSDAFADAVLDGAAELKALGADAVVAVGHSMGGMPITLAAAKDPAAFKGLVFLTALTAVPGKPSGAYLGIPAQVEGSILGKIFMADPAVVGGLRIDTASSDAAYYQAGKEALAADVPDDLWRTAVNMMAPDAPAAFYGEVIEFPAAYAAVERTFIRCGQDRSVAPGTQDAMIADMNAAWPDNPCRQIDLDTSHEAMFADPAGLANAIASTA